MHRFEAEHRLAARYRDWVRRVIAEMSKLRHIDIHIHICNHNQHFDDLYTRLEEKLATYTSNNKVTCIKVYNIKRERHKQTHPMERLDLVADWKPGQVGLSKDCSEGVELCDYEKPRWYNIDEDEEESGDLYYDSDEEAELELRELYPEYFSDYDSELDEDNEADEDDNEGEANENDDEEEQHEDDNDDGNGENDGVGKNNLEGKVKGGDREESGDSHSKNGDLDFDDGYDPEEDEDDEEVYQNDGGSI